ncbi:MAG: ABC transporter permease [Longimicrobiales bacterium]
MALDRDEGRVRDEVSHHLDELRAHLEARGWAPEEARAEALRRFGDPDRVERATRAVAASARGLPGGIRGDLSRALRGLRRAPAFTGAVVVTLALALGATITVFGVVWDVLVRPLDVPAPESLVMLREFQVEQGIADQATSAGTLQDWRRDLASVDEVGGWEWGSRTWEDPDRPEELLSVEIMGSAVELLGLRTIVGRALHTDDEVVGAPATTLMISHDLWQRRFGGDPGVVGRSIPVDGVGREIVGVLPPRIEIIGTDADLFVPSALVPADPTNRGIRTVAALARLAPGATVADAAAEVARLTESIAEAYPASARGWSATAVDLTGWMLGDVRPRLLVALTAVGLLWIVAAVNAANLFAVRAADGRREMAVRAALGAGRTALVRLRLVESGLLAVVGGLVGLLFAVSVRRWMVGLEVDLLPRAVEPGVGPVTVVFTVLAVVATAVAVGVVPAVRGAESAVSGVARGTAGAGPALRGRHALVVVQLATTVVLLVGAGLLVRTAREVAAVDLGFEPEGLVAARVSLSSQRYADRPAETAYFDRVLERVRALPGVSGAGITSALPMDPVAANFDLPTRADPATGWGEAPQADFRMVDEAVMQTMGYRLVDGRFLEPADRGGPMVAVVNRSLAELLWPDERAVGKQVQSVWRQDAFSEVVGVVEDTRFYGPREGARPELFFPKFHVGWSYMTVVARTAGDPEALQASLESILVEADPLLPPQGVLAVDELVADATTAERLYAVLVAAFAGVALILAAAGVYGVVAYTVRLRSREMGVRLALGATREAVVGGVLRRGVVLALTGVALGLLTAVPAARAVSELLFGVVPVDPPTLALVAGVLVTVAVAACLRPALRAGRLDPVAILRDE